jgi:HTH-type transcriptional regulator/antitoxin MqsA
MTNQKMQHPCLNCEQADMVQEARDVAVRAGNFSEVVAAVFGWHCPNCGEIEFLDDDGSERHAAALQRVHAQRSAEQRDWMKGVRKKLKLSQHEAAELTGGGHNAFGRYERGEVRPMPAAVNLFKILDRHPELLAEIR